MPNDFAREWIEKRLAGQVAEALSEVLGDTIAVRVVVDARAAELPQQFAAAEPAAGGAESAPPAAAPAKPRRPSGARAARAAKAAGDLNPRYVFDRFVTGP